MANDQITTLLIGQLETRTKIAGQSVRSAANALRTIAGQLREDDTSKALADVADRASDMVDRVGSYLEQSDFHTLMSDAEDFSRQRPWAVASIGLVGGLLASRLLKSTAARRHALSQPDPSPTQSVTDPAATRAQPRKTARRRERSGAVPTDGI